MSTQKIPPPFFVIRNSIHSSDHVNREESGGGSASSVGCELIVESNDERPSSSLAVVRLVEAPCRGAYMLDFCEAGDSFVDNFFAQNEIAYSDGGSNGDKTYLDGRAWKHLQVYSELVGKPIMASGKNEGAASKQQQHSQHNLHLDNAALASHHEGPFILLEDDVKAVIHTLLSMDRLFSWTSLVDARNRGDLRWQDIRMFLAQVRNGVPFVTQDGFLRHVVNTHLTFHQFVAFSRLVENHLESIDRESPTTLPDIEIYDIFPSFDSMEEEERRIELLASIKDKAVRTSATASGLVVPTKADDIVSTVECTETWRLYVQWWKDNHNIRNGFCMRELRYAETDVNVRRNAEKSGISLRGRHSQDPVAYEQYWRRFGCWYYGLPQEREGDPIVDGDMEKAVKIPAGLQTYDFTRGESITDLDPTRSRSSPVKMPNFQNKSWKPSSALERDSATIQQDNDGLLLSSLFMTVESLESVDVAVEHIPTTRTSIIEEISPQKQSNEPEVPSPKVISKDEIQNISDDKESNNNTLVVGSKIRAKPKARPVSFRHRFLKRVNSSIDNVTSIVNKKGGSSLRGKSLFRSKVRLVIMLKRFLGVSMQQFVAPENFDIFEVRVAAPPPKRKTRNEDPPKEVNQDDIRLRKELLEKAKAHHNQKLSRKVMKNWKRYILIMEEKKRQLEEKKRQLEEKERKEKEGLRMMLEKATALHQKSLVARFFNALRDHTTQQKNERVKDIPAPEPNDASEEPTVEPIVQEKVETRLPSVERDLFAAEDKRSLGLRAHCQKMFGIDSHLLDEIDCMELVVGRNRPSGLDIFSKDEYNERFCHGIELRSAPSSSVCSGISLLDQATLQKMKREKFAGKSNLFDVYRWNLLVTPHFQTTK